MSKNLICFTLKIDSSKEKKCCVSRTYAVCAGWHHNFGNQPYYWKKY